MKVCILPYMTQKHEKIEYKLKTLLKILLGSYWYEFWISFFRLGYPPNIKSPRTFNEKILHRKLFDFNPTFPLLADKIAARSIVEERVGSQYLTQLYWVGEETCEIVLDHLPQRFVIKASHGSGKDFIIFIKNKDEIRLSDLQNRCFGMLNKPYGLTTNEWWYDKVPRRLLFEEFLWDQETQIPLDYKFFAFHGKVHFIQVDYDRFINHTRTFYDCNWQPQPFILKYKGGKVIERPHCLSEMICVAETLANGYDFLRIDLYLVNKIRIVIGEITLAPGAGREKFDPPIWDHRLGLLW